MAKGTADTDAVNVSQLKGVTTALGGGAAVNTDGTIKAPSYDVGSTTGIATVGGAINALDDRIDGVNSTVTNITNGGGIKYFHTNSTAADSSASGSESVAIGGGAKAVGAASIAMGNNAQNVTGSNNSIAIGGDSKSSDKSVAIGNGADTSTVTYATAMGISSKVTGTAGTALGENSLASGAYGVALGSHATASASESVALGHNSVADRANSVSVGKVGGERQIINLAKGTADTDAVNVSQLKGITTAMGGGAAVNTDGTIKAPSYDVGSTTGIATVGGAINALDDRIDGVAANPLKFSGNSGTDVSRKLGDTLKISGLASTAGTFSGNNIKTVADATTGEIKIQMADAPKFGNIVASSTLRTAWTTATPPRLAS
ncbi:YadA family autotransporter adhesin [Lysobacter changpingensis]|uniref:YadA family autotransporter adhesin n=1 Tax=Lysobacter changpingensis TaxID=2792784 RepID=UPI001A90552C|nr:hypothetical protein [Lysobacter changpingensis]